MDFACFETLMKTKDWNKPSFGVIPDKNSSAVLDISFRKDTRTIFVQAKEVDDLFVDNFESWYREKTKGFIC